MKQIRRTSRVVVAAVAALVIATGAVACSDSNSEADSTTTVPTASTASTTSTSTTAAPEKLKILVSNDDGYSAPGIDAVVTALAAMPDTEVMVSAPATQQSGAGSKVTDGELKATEAETAGGYKTMAVQGTPADSVNWALDGGIDFKPDLVVTGINEGQNLGAIADQISGTVGAARAAVAHGIPALATSIGLAPNADYAGAAKFVVDWVKEHRKGLLDGDLAGDTPLLENLNVPHCPTGEPREVVDVTLSPVSDGALDAQNCESTVPAPSDDITAFINGFVTVSDVPPVAPAV